MEGSTDEGLLRDAAGDRITDLANHRRAMTDLAVQAGVRAGATPARLDVRRNDHPQGVVLILAGELVFATVSVLQERLVGLPGTLRPKPHRSGGDQEPALGVE
jgi:hypothetical protein